MVGFNKDLKTDVTFMSSGQNSQLWKHKASKNILSGTLTCLPRGSAQLLGMSRTPPQPSPIDLKHMWIVGKNGTYCSLAYDMWGVLPKLGLICADNLMTTDR